MARYPKKGSWATPKGVLTICSYCAAEDLGSLSMSETFARYSNYRPILSSKESLLRLAAEPDANVTVAANDDQLLVGVAVLQYPAASERWRRVGDGVIMEVSVIEVGRKWRSMGISKVLLDYLIDNPLEADRIFYMVGYSWTWDLAGTGLTPIEYRNMMIRLFSRKGFKTYQTNEPNITMRPENLFMARIGANVSVDIQKRFKQVRFNMDES